MGDLDKQIWLLARFSHRKLSNSSCSEQDMGKVWVQGSSAPSMNSIAWSQAFWGGQGIKFILGEDIPVPSILLRD